MIRRCSRQECASEREGGEGRELAVDGEGEEKRTVAGRARVGAGRGRGLAERKLYTPGYQPSPSAATGRQRGRRGERGEQRGRGWQMVVGRTARSVAAGEWEQAVAVAVAVAVAIAAPADSRDVSRAGWGQSGQERLAWAGRRGGGEAEAERGPRLTRSRYKSSRQLAQKFLVPKI
ncbi:hypothetical protein BD413DRAFT_65619 [Trametes elegans]|nr:hypothetical protein BD413DRAFT_65619 [Trametes elegans]